MCTVRLAVYIFDTGPSAEGLYTPAVTAKTQDTQLLFLE